MASVSSEASTTLAAASSEAQSDDQSPPSPSSAPAASIAPTTATATSTISTAREAEITHSIPQLPAYWDIPWSCTWTYDEAEEPQPGATGAVAWLDLEPVHGETTLSCYPESMFYGGRTGVFSPANCPHGWTTASVYVSAEEVLDGATTTAVCCSSEYSLDGRWCKRSVPTVLAVPITYNESAGTHEVFYSSRTTLYSATIAVHTIQALFREEDRASLGLGDEPEDSGRSGLSRNARIGVGIGVAIGGLLMIGILVFAIRRCRQRRRPPPTARGSKGRSMHELNALGAASRNGAAGSHDPRDTSDDASLSTHRRSHSNGATYPIYRHTIDTDRVSDDGNDSIMTREDEIMVLREKKAAIERRIDELQRVETVEQHQQHQQR